MAVPGSGLPAVVDCCSFVTLMKTESPDVEVEIEEAVLAGVTDHA